MENKDLIKEIERCYNEALKSDTKSFDYGITKDKRIIFIEINKNKYSITRNVLADKPDGIGDDLANKIWNWIQK